jgi:DNA polymerase
MIRTPSGAEQARALLRWCVEAGADEAIGESPANRYAEAPPRPTAEPAPADREASPRRPPPRPTATVPLALESTDAAAGNAAALAAPCQTLAELRDAFGRYEGCALKHTATNLVFGDGAASADVMLIGEAPGADEDREGLPFVGVSGRLLDRMIAAIGLDRTSAYITNVLPWRPPGNRKPTTAECMACLPFIRRHIALIEPRILIFVGGTAASALIGTTQGITRLRGRWLIYRDPAAPADSKGIPAMPILHPAYLLRQPVLKRETWHDLMSVRARLDEPG